MTKSDLQEKLVALYLRLNGYLTGGLIIHSAEENNVDGEIDILGMRFSNHQQDDRLIDCSKFLNIPTDSKLDIVIGEVKGGKHPLQFNKSIREHDDRRYKLLTWLGFLKDDEIARVSEDLRKLISVKKINNSQDFHRMDLQSELGLISIRPIIFAPDRPEPRENQIKYINGQSIIDFCWTCYRPETKRETCETNYWSINNWGEQFEDLVRYFKDPNRIELGNIKDLYDYFNLN